jgi:hypothetical protein
MKIRLILPALFFLMVTHAFCPSTQAAPGSASSADWNAGRKQVESLVAASRPNDAAAMMIQTLQAMQKSSVTDNDLDARKLIVEDLPDVVAGLIAQRKDYNNAETLCKWAISTCTAKFGSASPLTGMSYSPLVTVYSYPTNAVTPNRDQKKSEAMAKREQIRSAMTPAQRQDFLNLSIASAQHGMKQLDGQMQKLHAASDRFDQSVQRLQDTLQRARKN